MSAKHVIIPVFIPHKGCPFDCIYCNQKTISGQMEEMTVEKMQEVVEEHLSFIPQDAHVEIGFYGGSFTGIDKQQQEDFLRAAESYVHSGRVREIRLSTRPDFISSDILNTLAQYSVKTIELGVQSLDDEVLRQSCRGHGAQEVFQAAALIRHHGIRIGIQTMVGLPGDTRSKALETARKVVELQPAVVRIYPVLVIRGTYLQRLYETGLYQPLQLEEAVETCTDLLELYQINGISVIRMGLQRTDHINEAADVVTGPFHPAFRQLVESRLVLRRIEQIIREKGLAGSRSIRILTIPGNTSNIVGQKSANMEFLKTRYGFERIRVEEVKALKWDVDVEQL
jgi:histone acetyltransferase (RNA polymerase elongator complex component)